MFMFQDLDMPTPEVESLEALHHHTI